MISAHKTQKQNKTSFFNVFLHFLFIAECRTSFFNAAGNIFAIYIDYLRANLETKPEKKPKDNRKWRNLPHNSNNNKSNEALSGREKATACQKKRNNKKKAPTHTRTRQKNTDAEKSGTDNRQMLRFSSACLFSVRPQVCLSKRRSRNSLIAANRSP